ncbi:hypothetical protein L1987_06773 [Smallanthus sonchifolius]|uniref:Uncharacterized protein n=1 Tax=Smallanthus sonchifolius TaxID=185202 RepID=A0ACB9JZ57_9ASTR|nr:hypothetical protein L1987_06773 [Smallanthus sonchifolius]
MACSRVLLWFVFAISSSILSFSSAEKEYVLTLDHSNFSQVVSKNKFIVMRLESIANIGELYPSCLSDRCGHCKNLAPEYEKAASVLSSHDPPVALAKVDADAEENKGLAEQFELQGSLIDDNKVFVVGIFPILSGEEFENFTVLADKLRSDYDFGHTTNAELLPRGESPVTIPTISFQKFDVDDLEKFIVDSSIPLVTLFDQSPTNQPFLIKYFESPNAKAMLFLDFNHEHIDGFKSKYTDVAGLYKGKGLSFLLGDVKASQAALQDGSNNDIPSDTFEVQGYPTLYFKSSSGKVLAYEGNRTKEDIVDFIQKHRDGETIQAMATTTTTESAGKDEL